MTDNLEHHLTEFLRAFNERIGIVQRYEQLCTQIPPWRGFQDHARFIRDQREAIAVMEPYFWGMYPQMENHGMAAIESTDDAEVRDLVTEMLRLAADEAKDMRGLIEKLGNAGNLKGYLALAVDRLRNDAGRRQRTAELEQMTLDLTAYCLLHFPPAEDEDAC